jgi:hypothetical protein
MTNRYSAAYSASDWTIKLGDFITGLAVLLGFAVAVTIGIEAPNYVLAGVLIGAGIAFPGVYSGLILKVQGQMMQAKLDTAVNTSPLMDIHQQSESYGDHSKAARCASRCDVLASAKASFKCVPT